MGIREMTLKERKPEAHGGPPDTPRAEGNPGQPPGEQLRKSYP